MIAAPDDGGVDSILCPSGPLADGWERAGAYREPDDVGMRRSQTRGEVLPRRWLGNMQETHRMAGLFERRGKSS